MIRRWLCYLALLLSALVFHLYYYGWASWYFLLLVLAVPCLSLLVSLPAMLGQRIRWNWQTDARCSRGKTAVLRLGGRSAWIPAPRCQLRLQVTHLGSGQSISQALWLSEAAPVTLDTTHCGILRCQLTDGWVYDYLSLFRLPRKTPAARELMVLPLREEPQPKPRLAGLNYKRWQPKSGGGYAEQHELRECRPGDPLRSVHWKLTAKTDELIVREAMEPLRRLVLVTFDLVDDPDGLDRTLDRLCWLTEWLRSHGIYHELRWLEPSTGALCAAQIGQKEDFDAVLERLLRTPLTKNAPSLRQRPFPEADWRYHISADPGEGAAV